MVIPGNPNDGDTVGVLRGDFVVTCEQTEGTKQIIETVTQNPKKNVENEKK